jgi:hypothetical protein
MTSRLVRGGARYPMYGAAGAGSGPRDQPNPSLPRVQCSAEQCRALYAVIGALVVVASLARGTPAPRHGSLTLSVRSCPRLDPVSRAHAWPSGGWLHHTHVCIARWPAEHCFALCCIRDDVDIRSPDGHMYHCVPATRAPVDSPSNEPLGAGLEGWSRVALHGHLDRPGHTHRGL